MGREREISLSLGRFLCLLAQYMLELDKKEQRGNIMSEIKSVCGCGHLSENGRSHRARVERRAFVRFNNRRLNAMRRIENVPLSIIPERLCDGETRSLQLTSFVRMDEGICSYQIMNKCLPFHCITYVLICKARIKFKMYKHIKT